MLSRIFAVGLIPAAACATGQRYVVTTLQGLDGGFGFGSALVGPHALAANGTVVGTKYDRESNGSVVAYSNNGLVDYGSFGALSAMGAAVNDSGLIVGTAQGSDGSKSAFVLRDNAATFIGLLPGGSWSAALGINGRGQIIGIGDSTARRGERGYFYDQGRLIDIGDLGGAGAHPYAINDSGQIVGFSQAADTGAVFGHILAFIYEGGAMRELTGFGGTYTSAQDINSSGQIVGASEYPSSGPRHACIWAGDRTIDLGTLGEGSQSEAYAINDSGTVVGTADFNASGAFTAFVYKGNQMYDLDMLVEPVGDRPNVFPNVADRLLEADDVSSTGAILALSNSLGLVRLDPVVPGKITNFSVRGPANRDGVPLTLGFVLASDSTRVLVRAVGPGLATFGVSSFCSAPKLELHGGNTVLNSIIGSEGVSRDEMGSTGAFPIASAGRDAAVITALHAGVYTADVLPQDTGGGVSLLETYGFPDDAQEASLLNGSALVRIGQGPTTPIVGFTVSGKYGTSVLLRAVGKGLSKFGISDPALRPQIVLLDSQGNELATSDSALSKNGIVAKTMLALGAFKSDSAADDAVIMASIPAGRYTAMITSADSASGTALLELYEL